MKKKIFLDNFFYYKAIAVFLHIFLLTSCFGSGVDEVSDEFRQKMKEFSRKEGYEIAASLKNNTEWMDLPSVIEGIQDYMSHKEAPAGFEHKLKEYRKILTYLFEKSSETNLFKANTLLKSFETNSRMHSLENGKVWYEVIHEGQGMECVRKESSPLLHYSITTLGGEEIISTSLLCRPHSVCLKEAIPGLALGIEGMCRGEKRKIFIHPDMAYGIHGSLPPNSLLIAEVEVVSVYTETS